MTEQADAWSLLLSLQQRSQRANSRAELAFLMANETWHLLPYRQAYVYGRDALNRPELLCVSGLADLQGETPFTLWLGRVAKALGLVDGSSATRVITPEDLPENLREDWSEWWPEHVLLAPLQVGDGSSVGFVFYVRETAWGDTDIQLLGLLHETYAYCLRALHERRPGWRVRWAVFRSNQTRFRLMMVAVVAAMLFPVRLSTLAPAEIIALQAEAVAAPMDGIVKAFHVPPNTRVKTGDLLFSLDDTTLRNKREVAQKTLSVARAENLSTQQKAFDNLQSKGELAALQGRVREKEAELAYLEEMLGRVDVRASHDGVFVYADPNDWLGRPVVTGERLAQLAEPSQLGVLAWLPVNDAIALEEGTLMRVYLQVAPLSSMTARLSQTSYQATLSPDGIASYRIRGTLQGQADEARIGLRGVAKLYGGWYPFIYWALRRPIGSLRQWLGV